MELKSSNQQTLVYADVTAEPLGVDENNNVVLGYVVAEKGVFKNRWRGEFDDKSLREIVRLMKSNKEGTLVRYGHPSIADSSGDELDRFLGRAVNPRLDGDKVRADLHLNPVAFLGSNRGQHVMLRAKTDPTSFGTSLALKSDLEFRLDKHAKPKRDENGEQLPPLWRPTAVRASDIVAEGEAVHGGMLSADDPLAERSKVYELLDKAVDHDNPSEIMAEGVVLLQAYIAGRFGEQELLEKQADPVSDVKPDNGMSKDVAELNLILAERQASG